MWNKFLLIFFIPIIVILTLTAAFNFYVDPYHLQDKNGAEGVNYSRIYSADRERALKPLMYLREKPEVVILGNSKSAFSINPKETAEILNLKSGFNLSVRSATPYEIYELAKFAVNKNENLKHIIICLDFEMLGQNDLTKPGFSHSLLSTNFIPMEDKFSSALSISTFCDSLETIRKNSEEKLPIIYDKNGKISEEYLTNLFKIEGYFDRNSDINFIQYKLAQNDAKRKENYIKNYCRDILELHKLKEFLNEKTIAHTIIILPLNDDELTAVDNNFYKAFQKQITSIFPNIYDLTYANTGNKNLYYDAAHPKKGFTMELFSKVFNNKKIPLSKFTYNNNLAKGQKFSGEIKKDERIKTNLLSIDTKLLKYNVLHFTGDANIESADAYFLLENKAGNFLFKATRYGEPKSQSIFNIIAKKYERYNLDGRGITDNLPKGKYNVYLGFLNNNLFITDGVKTEFEI